MILSEGRGYEIHEAVHVVAEVTGANDPHKLVGKVKPKVELEQLGAEMLENSMILGDNAYDVVPGWAGTPETPFSEHLQSRKSDARAARTEEEMLGQFMDGTLG